MKLPGRFRHLARSVVRVFRLNGRFASEFVNHISPYRKPRHESYRYKSTLPRRVHHSTSVLRNRIEGDQLSACISFLVLVILRQVGGDGRRSAVLHPARIMADGTHDISSDRGDTRPFFASLEQLAELATMPFKSLVAVAQRFSEHVQTTHRQHVEEDLINDLLLSHGVSTRDKALLVSFSIQPGSNSRVIPHVPSLPSHDRRLSSLCTCRK